MRTKEGHIVVLLSNKGYVALENNQIFQLWKKERLGAVFNEHHKRYPNFEVSLGSLEKVQFNEAVEVYKQFINKQVETETAEQISITNFNKDLETGINTMKARNKAKVKAVAVIGINITAGVLHLGFQTMADTVCYAEAKIIDKMNVFDKTVEEIQLARRAKTKKTQESLINSPKSLHESVSRFNCRIRDVKESAIYQNNELTQNV